MCDFSVFASNCSSISSSQSFLKQVQCCLIGAIVKLCSRESQFFISSLISGLKVRQCAAKFSGGSGSVCYFRVPFSLATLTMDDGRLDKQTYLQTWRSIPNATEV